MILKLPPPETQVVRRMRTPEHGKPGKWHFLKPRAKEKARCGMFFSVAAWLEYSTVGEIKGNLCPVCWPWNEEKK